MNIKNWVSQHLSVGISLHVFAVWMFLLPSISMGVVTDQGVGLAIQELNAVTVPGQNIPGFDSGPGLGHNRIQGQKNAPGQLKMPGQKNEKGQDKHPKYVPGEVLVKFKNGIDEGKKKYIHDKMGTEVLSEIRQIGVHKIKSKHGKSTEELVRQYKSDPDVLYAEPNVIYQVQAEPNDPEFSKLWGMNNTGQTGGIVDADIDAPEAWDISTGSASVIVAVIDTGVDYTHPDLAANMVPGWDFVNNDNDPMDDYGHGTHVAGTIAAKGNNGIGVVGVSWQASIMPLKICDAAGNCDLWSAAQAVLYAANHGAKVANNSWGGAGAAAFSQTLLDAINEANQMGMLFVAAAGNSGNDNDRMPFYPCNYTTQNVLCVAASFSVDMKIAFSNFGAANVDLAAPGVDILSTVPSGTCPYCSSSGYLSLQGTSMAAPHVAGAAVLAISRFPSLSVEQVKNLLIGSVDTSVYFNGTYPNNIVASGGRLNVNEALRSDIIISASPAAVSVPAGQSTTFTITVKSMNNFSGDVTLSLAPTDPSLSISLNTSSVTLAADGTATATLTVFSTNGMTAGTYALTVQGSHTNALGQTQTRLGTVGVSVQTDLAVTALSGPSNGEAGGWFTVSDSVRNQGTGLAKEFYVGYYLSTDNLITESDVRIGSGWIPSLATGATNTQSMDVWVPSTLAAGTYYLGAIVADIYQVPDTDTVNNSLTTQTITIGSDTPASAAWVNRYNGPASNYDWASKIVTDVSGNSIVMGKACRVLESSGCGDNITIFKYDPNGITLWNATYSGNTMWGQDLAVDGLGNVYVSAAMCRTSSCANWDAITLKYDANGNALWSTPPQSSDTLPSALAVDGAGNAYMTGGHCDPAEGSCYITTIKYDANGNLLWDAREPASSNSGGRDIAVDSAGNVYVAADDTLHGYATIKYGPNGGTPLWQAYYQPNNGNHYNRALALDAWGNVYVSGLSHNDIFNYDIATVKYDNNGNQLWVRRYDNGGDDTVGWWLGSGQVVADAFGNVYISGASSNGLDEDYVTIKYDTNGNSLWTSRYGDAGWDVAMAMAIDNSENVYVTGFACIDLATHCAGWTTSLDYATIKYGSDGHPRWSGRYDGGWGVDMAQALAVDGSGNIFVTGPSGGQGSSYDYATLKYITDGPDLVITNVATTATSLPIGGSASFSTTVKNRGNVATSVSSTVGIYLSTDATITTGDILIASRTVAALAPGATSTADTGVATPSNLPQGTYYLGAIADVNNVQTEASEINNTLAGPALPVILDVDLTPTSVSTTTTSIPAGGTMTISDTIKNIGNSPMQDGNGNVVCFYLSTDGTFNGTYYSLVGCRSLAALAAGASSTASTTVGVPANVTPGIYYLMSSMGGGNNETNYSNNTLVGPTVTVTANILDLIVKSVGTTSLLLPSGGSAIAVNSVYNQGTTTATVFSIGIYLSVDANITTADTLVGSKALKSLVPNLVQSANTTITIPAGLPLGTYYVGAIADYTNTQNETIETNNSLAGGYTVTLVPNVDLQITGVSTRSSSAKVGTSITVSNTVKNAGTKATTASTTVGIYLSTDATITVEDTLIASRAVASLTAGASSSASTAATIPSGLASGTYYLGAIADKNNAQSEFNEDNNAMKASKTVTVTQ